MFLTRRRERQGRGPRVVTPFVAVTRGSKLYCPVIRGTSITCLDRGRTRGASRTDTEQLISLRAKEQENGGARREGLANEPEFTGNLTNHIAASRS